MSELVGAIQNTLNADLLRLRTIGQNLANLETPGYKSDKLISQPFTRVISSELEGADKLVIAKDFSQGAIKPTDNYWDLAIEGEGYFVGEKDGVTQYTRSGQLTMTSDGKLALPSGAYLLGKAGPIQLNSDQFEVRSDGTVISDGHSIDRLKIVTFSDQDSLRSIGAATFVAEGELRPTDSDGVQILQSFVEVSNVNTMDEIVSMMELTQHYRMTHNVLKAYESSISTSISTLGKF
ncbi:flagellar hook-basal body protein [Hahella ganghwensis]|uniref:flagellar hook-basal body protein n=1 Tax=Hahella ganghwensis TaxID=286420 RepID=UPI00036D4CE6|nr:flagellar hook basal-body protein [Hahella ganghwensis]